MRKTVLDNFTNSVSSKITLYISYVFFKNSSYGLCGVNSSLCEGEKGYKTASYIYINSPPVRFNENSMRYVKK